MNTKNKILSFFLENKTVLFIFFILIYTNFNIQRWKLKEVIKWDVISYYSYLPATFIHHDLSLDFVDQDEKFYTENEMFWPQKTPEGKKVIKMTMGLSLLYAPFFSIAHLEAKLGKHNASGFSVPYHKWIHLSALFYLFFGFFYLHKFLTKYFNSTIASFTTICILFGTNLFYYSTTEAAMSHAYTFSLMSIFIYHFDLWYQNANYKRSFIIAISLGFMVLLRPSNIFILLFALLYKTENISDIQKNLKLFLNQNLKYVLMIFLICCIIIFPQFIYWKIQTGHWIYNSYINESFYFSKPQIINYLFSFRKGWLLYTPIMLFAILGFFSLYKNNKTFFLACFPLTILAIYVFSCWWCWWFGGSFGMRSMIDFYPVLAIPFASLCQHLISFKKKKASALIFCTFILACIVLNLFQTYQYRKHIIHWDGMTKTAYIKTFGKNKKDPNFNQYYQTPDYTKALKGEN